MYARLHRHLLNCVTDRRQLFFCVRFFVRQESDRLSLLHPFLWIAYQQPVSLSLPPLLHHRIGLVMSPLLIAPETGSESARVNACVCAGMCLREAIRA